MEKLINLVLIVYRFFTRRWAKIEQAADLVTDLGEELSEELKQADVSPGNTGSDSGETKS